MGMSSLPKGWKEEKLGDISTLNYGKNLLTNKFLDKGYPVFGANGHIGYYSEYHFEEKQLLMTCRGATCGNINVSVPYSFVTNNSIVIKDFKTKVYFDYLKRILMWLSKDSIITGTAQPQVTIQNLQELLIPLPQSIDEQIRIVEQLELLFEKTNSAKERLEKIPTILKRFRQSVLSSACSGRLTTDWRKKNECGEWEDTVLSEVIIGKPRNGYSPVGVKYQTPYKNLTLSATTSGRFKKECFKYVDIDITGDSYLWLKTNDILVQRSNSLEYVGTCAIYDGENNEFIYPDIMMKVVANIDKALPHYLNYALSTLETRTYYMNNATGTAGNMPKINQPTVMGTPIMLPPLDEQEEIVRRVDKLFALTDKIEQRYKNAKAQIERVEKAIYAKAFRGELVRQGE